MINLEDKIGLLVLLHDDNRLEFGEGVEHDGMSVRKFSDLAPVVAKDGIDLSDEPAYYMYRNVRKKVDKEKIESKNLRFDLTVIPPAMLGEEYIKTSGHYHPKKEGTQIEYPEFYFVVEGEATYLMQKSDGSGNIEDVIISRVKGPAPIMMPVNYGHITINETKKPIVMANWVGSEFSSEYGEYEENRGGAYYIKNGEIVKNDKYQNIPDFRELKSDPKLISDANNLPIYSYLDSIDLTFLDKPEDFQNDLSVESLFIQ